MRRTKRPLSASLEEWPGQLATRERANLHHSTWAFTDREDCTATWAREGFAEVKRDMVAVTATAT
jgi:hypothetical protein